MAMSILHTPERRRLDEITRQMDADHAAAGEAMRRGDREAYQKLIAATWKDYPEYVRLLALLPKSEQDEIANKAIRDIATAFLGAITGRKAVPSV
jgi:hypothetical protein